MGVHKRIFSMFPGPAEGRFWVYVLGTDGTVKVGRTADPRKRLNLHRIRLRGAMRWCHLLGCCDKDFAQMAERYAIDALRLVCERIGMTEEFRGSITKAEAIGICRGAFQRAHRARMEAAAREAAYDASTEAYSDAYESFMGSLLIDDEV
jgi:hypothetical protein